MLRSSTPLNVRNVAKVAPKDTGRPQYVKLGAPTPVSTPAAERPDSVPVSLAIAVKIRINRAIRGSRPGAERTVSAISPLGDLDAAGPVGPSSRASAF